ncbi:T9SS type A sorting domain-containing protein [Flavobacterium sp. Sd200]|uniref:T9SS type A sorting domain-containing protein n=1 Tax=Flavobacterium sp. Sd200 TaxID=2692211 RepID=UPI00136806A1|nr:T9SS type A sorting domain-containing protein [Flavobacterium sp. Sd200]MXN91996.1 T9SS type A sorting domain-containing protein [Flavobacterium sp. Sd200]
MKKFIFLFLLVCITANAQREFWGVSEYTNFSDVQGNIVKFDINGENAITMHHFNYPTGKLPRGKLFLSSNGKLYGTAAFGGIGSTTSTNEQDGYGILYEYDLTFDTYNVVHYFDFPLMPNGNSATNPFTSIIEPVPGKLYGGVANRFYVYDIATETVSFLNHNYSFEAMGPINDLIKASDGFLYAVSNQAFPCTSPAPNQSNQGSILKVNTSNNTVQKVAYFNCDGSTGIGGKTMIEALPNKIFFLSSGGYVFLPDEGYALPAGTIIEFDMLTNTLTTKVTFDFFNSLGYEPSGFVLINGNLYGVCTGGGDTYKNGYTSGIFNKTGTIWEYNPNDNTIVKLTDLDLNRFGPCNITESSDGYLAGNLTNSGVFKYNADDNSLRFSDLNTYSDPGNQFYTRNLIEVCRKPSYSYIENDTYTICEGEPFTYDLNNTNATGYTWKRNDQIIASQTTGVLSLNDLEVSDSGDYTCDMVNECGTTITMPIHITVEACMGLDEAIGYKNVISLYPNPTDDIINIKLPENPNFTVTSVAIYNMLGQEVYSDTSKYNGINVGTFSRGIYIIKLATDKGEWQSKFIKK